MNKSSSNTAVSERTDERTDSQRFQRRLLPSLNLYGSNLNVRNQTPFLSSQNNSNFGYGTRRTVSANALTSVHPPPLSATFQQHQQHNFPPFDCLQCPPQFIQEIPPYQGGGPPPRSQQQQYSPPSSASPYPYHIPESMEARLELFRQLEYDLAASAQRNAVNSFQQQQQQHESYKQIPMYSPIIGQEAMQQRSECNDGLSWRGEPIQNVMGASITSRGFISFRLRNHTYLDLTVDRAVRIINYESKIIMALSACGTKAAFIHPSGCVYQYTANEVNEPIGDVCIEVCTNEIHGSLKYAKLCSKGVSFSAENHALIYLVDDAGTRSSSDIFSDMTGDFTMPTFLNNSIHEPMARSECLRLLQNTKYWKNRDGTDNWIINGIRIVQENDGHVRVARDQLRYQLRTNPSNGNGSISTPYLHTTASIDGHLFVKRGSKRIHYDGRNFVVRNGSHSSGFDQHTQLKLYG